MLCSIPCGSLQSYFAILTRFKKKPVLYSIGTIIHLFIQISISIIGVVVLRKGISSVFFAILIAELFSIFYYGIINKEFLAFTFEKKHLKKALLFSIPTIPAILAGWIDNSFGQILIGKYVSLDDLGVYSIALSLASVFSFISIALNNVWYPFLYENYKKPSFPALLEKLYTIILAILILITVSISMFSKEIILLLANPNYIQASVYITLLCIPTCVYLLFPFVSSGVSISRDTKYIAISYIVGCIINFCCLLITLPRYGVIAVPVCLALSRITTYIILYRVSSLKIRLKLPNKLLVVLISTAALCFIVSNFHLPLLIRAFIVFGTFTSILCYFFRHRTSFDMAKSLFKIKRSN
jgi:O-antigen/teichoic acid export membrane protein